MDVSEKGNDWDGTEIEDEYSSISISQQSICGDHPQRSSGDRHRRTPACIREVVPHVPLDCIGMLWISAGLGLSMYRDFYGRVGGDPQPTASPVRRSGDIFLESIKPNNKKLF